MGTDDKKAETVITPATAPGTATPAPKTQHQGEVPAGGAQQMGDPSKPEDSKHQAGPAK